jgi:type IV pilus assembly protein PilY1
VGNTLTKAIVLPVRRKRYAIASQTVDVRGRSIGWWQTLCGSIQRGLRAPLLLWLMLLPVLQPSVHSAELNLADTPLFISGSKTALVQLIMQRDNKLFFEAYPSYEDINQDGVLDIRYKPHEIDYYGYFDSYFCYQNLTGTYLEAVATTADKKCTVGWSGDFLNFLSMTRMDVMLRALYGGRREIDTADGLTILRRAFVPWENHTWGVPYNSLAEDGYLISDYSPLSEPVANTRHLLSTSNVKMDDVPYLRVRENTTDEIWQWVDKEGSQGDEWASFEVVLDVRVCKDGFLEEACQQYPNNHYKPVGLLHEFGENNAMYFSLLSGSYENNLQGGVLRQPVTSFGDNEVDRVSGVFTRAPGIVTSLDAIRIPNDYLQRRGKTGTVQADCGWINDRPFQNGECRAWGNPIAEMMYEGLRYFSGAEVPTDAFETVGGMDEQLGLSAAVWNDPYSGAADQPYAQCSSAYQLVISDPSPSFDGDQLPGSDFSSFTGDGLPDLDVGALADKISKNESTLPGLKFIGQVGTLNDGSPSPKEVTTFRNIRGLAPEAPHRQGSYYAPSVSYFGHQNDIHPNAPGVQNVGNFTLALGSPLPSIDVEVGTKKISFAPFAKTVKFCSQNSTYYPTNAIVGFTVEEITPTSGSFRVSFEDMEQGADNDMDAVSRYRYSVTGNTVRMKVDSLVASGCAIQHMGYTVSGSNKDGVYLVVRDTDTNARIDPDYELDVPPSETPGSGWADRTALPLTSTIDFTPGTVTAAEQLPSPLWYAAKWGGFNDLNGDRIPQREEWDADNDGAPDNYFPVTDPSRMAQTMRSVFNRISEQAGAATAVSVSSGSLDTGNRVYSASFRSGKWTGDVVSKEITSDAVISDTFDWSASDELVARVAAGIPRQIITYNPDSRQGVPFQWPADVASPQNDEISASQVNWLRRNPITDLEDDLGESRLTYLRGEEIDGLRNRSTPLGDIVHSSPMLVGVPSSFFPDNWGTAAPENAAAYSSFGRDNRERRRVLYVGANDGMLHAFDAGQWTGAEWSAGTGEELFAYVPSPVFSRLSALTNPKYTHKYYVDASPRAADVFINGAWRTVLIGALGRGGQGVYALDITDPDAITEAGAGDAVLWEFTDREDRGLGFTYSSPIIARMHNGKWVAIVGNGYNNSTRNEGYSRGGGWSSIILIDIATGQKIRKLFPGQAGCRGQVSTPNAMAEPTAVDINGDNIIDSIYAGDLYGCVYRFDVSDTNVANWSNGEVIHQAVDDNGNRSPITSAVTVGSHPTGTGVMVYFGTGKYLEPSDQRSTSQHRIYGIWDKGPGYDTKRLTRISSNNMLQQTITLEDTFEYDTDDDGIDDTSVPIRETSRNPIDWTVHEGWYMDLVYGTALGEQVLATPVLRDGKLLVSTHIPTGDECAPQQQGWLMILNAANGGMADTGLLDIDDDGLLNEPPIAGIGNLGNPFAAPTLVAGADRDVLITQAEIDPEPETISLASSFIDGRMTWRELEP